MYNLRRTRGYIGVCQDTLGLRVAFVRRGYPLFVWSLYHN